MIKDIQLKNFKGLKEVNLPLSKFSVLTGLNSAGKTSVLQSLVLLKQSLNRKEVTYNDYLLNLGDFRETVHRHDTSLPIGVGLTLDLEGQEIQYDVEISAGSTAESLAIDGEHAWAWDSSWPRAMEPAGRLFLSQAASGYGGGEYADASPDSINKAVGAQKEIADWFENMLYLSSHRGFTKYSYPMLSGSPSLDEVAKRAGDATLLEEWLANLIMYRINEAKRYSKARTQLDVMSERLSRVGVDINPYVLAGPSVVVDLTENDMWVSAVNSGYGINQLVASIALGTLMPEGSLVMIEEPEIHLHPKLQRIVCEIFIEIANEGKQILITSHSDHFMQTLKKAIEEGSMSADDIKAYNFKKENRQTVPREIDVTDQATLDELFGA